MPVVFLVEQSLSLSWQDYGVFLLETLVALFVIALGAWAVVRFSGGRINRKKGSRLKVVERLGLEPRRSIYIVEVDQETLLIGVSEGSVQLVKQLGPQKDRGDGDDTGAKK